MISFETGRLTDVGKRRSVNQDRVFLESADIDGTTYALYAVADGMGGLSDGERAAEICMRQLADWWMEHIISASGDRPEPTKANFSLYDLFYSANDMVLRQSGLLGKMMGSTLTMAYFKDNKYVIGHVGDCRIYNIKRRSANILTTDHTWVAKQVEAGVISKKKAATHPKGHILTNCIGNKTNFFVDLSVNTIAVGEMLMLCSDGLYKYIKQRSIPKYFRNTSLQHGLNKIRDYIIFKLPADDNISAVAVKNLGGRNENKVFSLKNLFINS
ncbi:MAG: serine/threonine-protein phosphatase [Clostridiales bacterium]|jgi:protein phosphatase|nr:serine/threonine-protein phosphatase [Clostridiales bacterium]